MFTKKITLLLFAAAGSLVGACSDSFTYTIGSTQVPSGLVCEVTPTGGAYAYTSVVTYTSPANPPKRWLTVSPASGTISAGSTGKINYNIDPLGLPAGNYSATVTRHATGFADAVNQIQLQILSGSVTTTTTPVHIVLPSISGLTVIIDGSSYTSNQDFSWVIGSVHTISVPPLTIGGNQIAFSISTSDGSASGNPLQFKVTSISVSFSITQVAPAPPLTGSITSGGVVSATAFGGFSTAAPGSWIEIYGSNLSGTTRSWASRDFDNGTAPTALDGVSVTVGGQKSYVSYVSAKQVNAYIPLTVPTGRQQLTITNANGTTAPYTITLNPTQPGLLAPAAMKIGGKQYVAAILPDGKYALPSSAVPDVMSRPARPGETVVIYGIGFGPVTPSVAAGQIVTAPDRTSTAVQMLFGATPASIVYGGSAPNFLGLYQFNVMVPTVPDNEAMLLTFSAGETKGTQTLYIAVKN